MTYKNALLTQRLSALLEMLQVTTYNYIYIMLI